MAVTAVFFNSVDLGSIYPDIVGEPPEDFTGVLPEGSDAVAPGLIHLIGTDDETGEEQFLTVPVGQLDSHYTEGLMIGALASAGNFEHLAQWPAFADADFSDEQWQSLVGTTKEQIVGRAENFSTLITLIEAGVLDDPTLSDDDDEG